MFLKNPPSGGVMILKNHNYPETFKEKMDMTWHLVCEIMARPARADEKRKGYDPVLVPVKYLGHHSRSGPSGA